MISHDLEPEHERLDDEQTLAQRELDRLAVEAASLLD